MFIPIADQHKCVYFLVFLCFLFCIGLCMLISCFVCVFGLFLGLWCHHGIFGNIGRDMSFLYFRECTQELGLVIMRGSNLYLLPTTLSGSVSSIWSMMHFNG